MRAFVLIFCSLCFGASHCFSQNRIEKTILDSSTKKPIQFANIVLTNNRQYGTISNEDGVFVLYINKSDSVEISHISYFKARLPSTFLNDTIYLEVATTLLGEVIIKDLNANEIINRVIDDLELNHSVEPVTYSSFIRIVDYPKDTSVIHLFEEHLVNIYQTKDHNSKFKILKTRVGAFSDVGQKRIKDLRLITMISVYTDNLFRYRPDYLKNRKAKNYRYTFIDNTSSADSSFYMIDCRLRSDTSQLVAHLFIDKKTFAIARLTKYYKNESGGSDYTDILFSQYDEKWYLSTSWRHFENVAYERFGAVGSTYTDRICVYSLMNEAVDLKGFKSTIDVFAEPVKRYKGNFDDGFWETDTHMAIPNWIKNKIDINN